jgi:hypothetical protein
LRLSRDNLATVEQARILVLERGLQEERKQAQRAKPKPAWDRDRGDWPGTNSTIAPSPERKFRPPAKTCLSA